MTIRENFFLRWSLRSPLTNALLLPSISGVTYRSCTKFSGKSWSNCSMTYVRAAAVMSLLKGEREC